MNWDFVVVLVVCLTLLLILGGVVLWQYLAQKQDMQKSDEEAIDDAIKTAGYAYDPVQDIFYSRQDAWQRELGYCRLYDEAASAFGMIVDCEPIHFHYDGQEWLIEFWKGQYDLTTGCEIGVYKADGTSGFYQSIDDDEMLTMQCSLWKDQHLLFHRKDRHWWLTGFKLGEFAEPSQLTMELSIQFDNRTMRDAFLDGLYKAGYIETEVKTSSRSVRLTFHQPKTSQPVTRTAVTDAFIQSKNQLLCRTYQQVTEPYQTFPDKLQALKLQAPWLFHKLLSLGRVEEFLQVRNSHFML